MRTIVFGAASSLFLLLASLPAAATDAEYAVAWTQGYQAQNHAQGFRAHFTEQGVRAVPGVDGEASWKWGLQWVGLGRKDAVSPVPEAVVAAEGSRIDYRRGALHEWYENGPRGLKQGFVLPSPPEGQGAGPVHLDLALTGTLFPVFAEDGQSIDFLSVEGVRVLRYAELRVTDARGEDVPSHMEGFVSEGARGVRLVLDDRDAVYPVTVDPLTFAAVWTNESNQANAEFGKSVGTAGDVNGDGYADLIVGAPFYDGEGRAFVYLGSASGLAPAPAWTVESDQSAARFGWAVGTAGDVNGDGYSDVIVTAPRYDNGSTDEGRVYVYLGSASGLSLTAAWTKESDQGSAQFGISAATAGDVNGDGYADVIVGSHLYDNGSTDEGRAFVYLGSAGGLGAAPAWTAESNQASAWYGWAVATAGDTNGDGFADVIVGSPLYDNGSTDEGRAYLYFGSASGPSLTHSWFQESNQAGAQFGYSVATAGDVDGFGYADVLVGAWQFTNVEAFEGRAFLYLGGVGGPAGFAITTFENNVADSYMGWSVGPAGDVNGDGYGDILVTAPFYFTSPTVGGGRAIVFLGDPAIQMTQTWSHTRSLANAAYGWSAATAGDVNGDGLADIVVGAPWDDNGHTNEGLAYVYHGTPGFLSNIAGWNESNQTSAQMGTALASVGDVNGDGYAEHVVGSPLWDGGDPDEGKATLYYGSVDGPVTSLWPGEGDQAFARYGAAVAGAGDVNGDGYDDVIVGAPFYDNFVTDDGRAVVYLGSAAGLTSTIAWSTRGGVSGVEYGASVAGVGDVNGDGYDDVMVGAPKYSNGETQEGRASLFLGSAAGLSTIAAWTGEGGQTAADYGRSVAAAGDVNGDGFADVIVGAPFFDSGTSNNGKAFVYLGSAAGLAAAPVWTAQGANNGERLGTAVSGAGDTNGDGYADVMVGAPFAPTPHVDFFLGYNLGVLTTPYHTAVSQGSFAGSQMGISVSAAGDVNGDGFADVVLGVPQQDQSVVDEAFYGSGYVLYGSPTGVTNINSATYSNVGNDKFGVAVTGGGDINGDGYAEVLVGAPLFDAPQIDEGRFFLFQGGGIEGVAVNPRQRVSDATRPISRGGHADVGNAFRLQALARTPYGRGKARLEWEVKPWGTVLDGSGTAFGASFVDTGTSGGLLNETVQNLVPGSRYHWRMRLVYDQASVPFVKKSRWFTMPWGGWNEAMLRTGPQAAGRASTMTIFKVGLGVTIDWTLDSSCLESDADYALYEGTLGNFTSHIPVTCTSGPGSSWNFTPAAGNRYFLLVPINATREGSYGLGVGGAERPASASACKPQAIAACP